MACLCAGGQPTWGAAARGARPRDIRNVIRLHFSVCSSRCPGNGEERGAVPGPGLSRRPPGSRRRPPHPTPTPVPGRGRAGPSGSHGVHGDGPSGPWEAAFNPGMFPGDMDKVNENHACHTQGKRGLLEAPLEPDGRDLSRRAPWVLSGDARPRNALHRPARVTACVTLGEDFEKVCWSRKNAVCDKG